MGKDTISVNNDVLQSRARTMAATASWAMPYVKMPLPQNAHSIATTERQGPTIKSAEIMDQKQKKPTFNELYQQSYNSIFEQYIMNGKSEYKQVDSGSSKKVIDLKKQALSGNSGERESARAQLTKLGNKQRLESQGAQPSISELALADALDKAPLYT